MLPSDEMTKGSTGYGMTLFLCFMVAIGCLADR